MSPMAMEGLFIIGIFLAALWWVTRPRGGAASWRHPWVRAGRELGLAPTQDGVAGRVGRLEVSLAVDQGHLRIRVDGRETIPIDLVAGPAASAAEAVQTGDPVFDARVQVSGDVEVVAALLGWETRQALMAAVGDLGCTLRGGVLEATLRGPAPDPDLIVAQVRQLLVLARRLRWRAEAAAERLYDNAAEDPKPGVRLANLALLLARHAESEFADQALARAGDDPDARVRSAAGAAGAVARRA